MSDPPTILIADDDAALRQLWSYVLTNAGATVLAAGTTEAARELALTRRPDLVVADVHMPGGGGPQLAVDLAAALGDDGPPVVLSTGSDVALGPRPPGVTRWLLKPVLPDLMVGTVNDLLGTSLSLGR